MITESTFQVFPDVGRRSNGNLEESIGMMLREHRSAAIFDRERDLNIYRSGSAPPTVEGSLSAIGSLFLHPPPLAAAAAAVPPQRRGTALSDEALKSHPDYPSYYYSLEDLNPRLPPPTMSKEDWRFAQRLQAGAAVAASPGFGGIGERRRKDPAEDGDGRSLFASQPGISPVKGEGEQRKLAAQQPSLSRQPSAEWLERDTDGLIGLAGVGLGARKKSLADMIQEGLRCSASTSGHLSRPVSRNAFDNMVDELYVPDAALPQLQNGLETVDGIRSGATGPSLVRVQSVGSSVSNSFASTLASSLSRSTTPDPHMIQRSASPCLPPIGGMSVSDKKTVCGSNSKNGVETELNGSKMSSDGQAKMPKGTSSFSNMNSRGTAAGSSTLDGSHYQNTDVPSMDISGFNSNAYSMNQRLPSVTTNQLDAGGMDGQSLHRSGNLVGPGHQASAMDPLYLQYLQRTSDYAAQASANLNGPSLGRHYMNASHLDLLGLQKAYLGLLAQHKAQYALPFSSKSGLSPGYYAAPAFGHSVPYPGNPLVSTVLHPAGAGSPIRPNERLLRFPSLMRSSTGETMGPWHPENDGNVEEFFASSLLEELKNNKTRPFELLDIVDHVVEFSVDQYGSRFIQQKLETASVDEKNKIFLEIILHARALMTDVFGNYVIQKFFEHGTESQRKELASQLSGHVLSLSLQMYGCRVIQKALEVVDVDTQTKMVLELDGSVMKCVRDQNGNHVIQKGIECVPQERIEFIISAFYGQVVALSTHPYGCRVIQRVLEHCDDPETQRIMMEEILQSVCTLAQDQYGNYVVQHVLQHGKKHERSAIINKLAGQIVKMSQQKFASNVVEKCLTFGGPEERQLLVNEMLGTTDENEPLQAMMKDQFANYVVQKVLETCDDQSRELILSRIKVHLNALKQYTYGKHIVTRVEKLITTGERHVGVSSSYSL